MTFSASFDHNRSRSARLSPALRNSVASLCADFCSRRNWILARRKLTQLTCPRGCGRASFAEGRACSPPHPCGTVRGVRGASLAEGRARSPPARSRTDISNPPGRSPPPCRRARVREPEPDPGARGLSPPSRGTGARDHLKGAATAPCLRTQYPPANATYTQLRVARPHPSGPHGPPPSTSVRAMAGLANRRWALKARFRVRGGGGEHRKV